VSRSAEQGGMVYAQAAASEPKEVLEQIDELLQALGASKANLLTARVLLPDMGLFADYENAWNEWLGPWRRPLRVCKVNESGLIDITVTGLRMRASPSRSPHVQGRPSQG
jgi:enamine deaminase RidA (YjgF/YER057c/UK114 family)